MHLHIYMIACLYVQTDSRHTNTHTLICTLIVCMLKIKPKSRALLILGKY